MKNAKNNNSNKAKSRRRKVFQFQRSATVLIVFFATILAIIFGSVRVMTYSGKILFTQIQMLRCYSNVQKLEESRNYNLDMAYTYPGGASSYVHAAEKADEQIEYWNSVRYGYVHSDDPVIANAAKDGFELDIFAVSLITCCVFIALVVATIWLRSRLFVLFQLEILVFDMIMCGLFFIFKFALARITKFVSMEYRFFDRCWKNDLKLLNDSIPHKRKRGDDTVVPFEHKKTEKRRRYKIG